MTLARDMAADARRASDFLKALTNSSRLLVLCHLAEGEKTVSELERRLGLRQPTLSQQLARLRADCLVETRREGKHIYYSLASLEVRRVLDLLYELFCAPGAARSAQRAVAERRLSAPGPEPRDQALP